DSVRLGRVSGRLNLITVEELECQVDARTTDGGRVGHSSALEARIALLVEQLRDESAEIRTDDRHEVLAGILDRGNDLGVHAGRPDAVHVVVVTSGNEVRG